jgi:hypothetical protein
VTTGRICDQSPIEHGPNAHEIASPPEARETGLASTRHPVSRHFVGFHFVDQEYTVTLASNRATNQFLGQLCAVPICASVRRCVTIDLSASHSSGLAKRTSIFRVPWFGEHRRSYRRRWRERKRPMGTNFWQLGEVGGDAPGFVARQHLR